MWEVTANSTSRELVRVLRRLLRMTRAGSDFQHNLYWIGGRGLVVCKRLTVIPAGVSYGELCIQMPFTPAEEKPYLIQPYVSLT